MAMRDVKWQDHLHSTDHEAIMKAYHAEWDALKSSILDRVGPIAPRVRRGGEARHGRQVHSRVQAHGCLEGEGGRAWVRGGQGVLGRRGFDYAANVCEISAVRNLLFEPRESPYTGKTDGPADGNNDNGDNTANSDPIVIGQADVRTAYLQSDRFGPDEPRATFE